MSKPAGPGWNFLSWFLLSNLLLIRYFRPIFTLLAIFSFRIWIDWLLLAISITRRQSLIGTSGGVALLLSAFVIIYNLFEHGLGDFGLLEATSLFLVLSVPLFYASLINSSQPDQFRDHRKILLRILNIYFFGNALFVYAQYLGVVPIAGAFLAAHPFVADQLTGLIGLNGVSTLNFLWIATIAGNLRARQLDGRRRFYAFAAIQFVIAAWLSTLNDNKMFTLTAAAAALVYLAFNAGALKRYIIVVLAMIAIAVPLAIDAISSAFTTKSGASLDLLSVVFYNPNFQPNPNNERAFINDLAYRFYNSFGTGIGLGQANDTSYWIHTHIGINSASLILIQGGLPLLVASVVILYVGLHSMVRPSSLLINSATFGLTVVLMYASNPISDRYTLIAVCLFMFFLAPAQKEWNPDGGPATRIGPRIV